MSMDDAKRTHQDSFRIALRLAHATARAVVRRARALQRPLLCFFRGLFLSLLFFGDVSFKLIERRPAHSVEVGTLPSAIIGFHPCPKHDQAACDQSRIQLAAS